MTEEDGCAVFRTVVERGRFPSAGVEWERVVGTLEYEPQMVAALARLGARVAQVAVSYDPRSTAEGKKIGWVDGFRALYVMARERLRRTPPSPLITSANGLLRYFSLWRFSCEISSDVTSSTPRCQV